MTRRNRRFLKKIVSTLADKELVVENDDKDADVRKSSRLMNRGAVERKSKRLEEKCKRSVGGDVRKVEINKVEIDKKRWR